MRITATLSAIAVLFLIPALSIAQDDELPVNFGVKAGWFINSFEPMSDLVENNWIVGADAIYWFDTSYGAGAEIQYMTKDDEDFDFNNTTVDFEYTAIPVHADLYYRMKVSDSTESHIYFGGGASFVFADLLVESPLATLEADDTVVGFNVKGGFQYNRFFGEIQYMCAEWEDDAVVSYFDEEDYVNLGGFSFWLGIRF